MNEKYVSAIDYESKIQLFKFLGFGVDYKKHLINIENSFVDEEFSIIIDDLHNSNASQVNTFYDGAVEVYVHHYRIIDEIIGIVYRTETL